MLQSVGSTVTDKILKPIEQGAGLGNSVSFGTWLAIIARNMLPPSPG